MCGLCGVLGSENHWTDATGNTAVFAERQPRQTRTQERHYRVRLVNKVLGHYGFRLRDWNGNAYLLSTPTGRTEMVPNLGALWPVAEAMAKRPCDPLDRALIAALGAAPGEGVP